MPVPVPRSFFGCFVVCLALHQHQHQTHTPTPTHTRARHRFISGIMMMIQGLFTILVTVLHICWAPFHQQGQTQIAELYTNATQVLEPVVTYVATPAPLSLIEVATDAGIVTTTRLRVCFYCFWRGWIGCVSVCSWPGWTGCWAVLAHAAIVGLRLAGCNVMAHA